MIKSIKKTQLGHQCSKTAKPKKTTTQSSSYFACFALPCFAKGRMGGNSNQKVKQFKSLKYIQIIKCLRISKLMIFLRVLYSLFAILDILLFFCNFLDHLYYCSLIPKAKIQLDQQQVFFNTNANKSSGPKVLNTSNRNNKFQCRLRHLLIRYLRREQSQQYQDKRPPILTRLNFSHSFAILQRSECKFEEIAQISPSFEPWSTPIHIFLMEKLLKIKICLYDAIIEQKTAEEGSPSSKNSKIKEILIVLYYLNLKSFLIIRTQAIIKNRMDFSRSQREYQNYFQIFESKKTSKLTLEQLLIDNYRKRVTLTL